MKRSDPLDVQRLWRTESRVADEYARTSAEVVAGLIDPKNARRIAESRARQAVGDDAWNDFKAFAPWPEKQMRTREANGVAMGELAEARRGSRRGVRARQRVTIANAAEPDQG